MGRLVSPPLNLTLTPNLDLRPREIKSKIKSRYTRMHFFVQRCELRDFCDKVAASQQISPFAGSRGFCFIWPMTIRALEKEVLELPPRSRVRLAEKLLESVDDFTSQEVEAAWSGEIGRRVEEIQSGRIKGIPASEAMARARRTLHEARQISSARRK